MFMPLRILVLIALIPLLCSCAYRTTVIKQDGGFFHEPNDFVLQVDDEGNFWNKEDENRIINIIKNEVKNKNTIVIVFVHGWHHNADPYDTNARDFALSLKKTRALLNDSSSDVVGPYTQSRKILTGTSDVNVIGLYVGWRGRSLPMPLNFSTFWGRKRAAERVGSGDLKSFLMKLNGIYRERSDARLYSANTPFMGLVTFGHSFGGQVVFKAVAETIKKELAENKTGPLQGFGDLTVLVNPALEAAQYEDIHQIASRRSYPSSQSPVFLVVSSQGDWARKWAFPIGRALGSISRSKPDDERWPLWGKALGEYKSQRTHAITVRLKDPLIEQSFDPVEYSKNPCKVAKWDLSAAKKYGNVDFRPLSPDRQYNPFIVAYTDNDLVIGHSGVFEDSLRNFINDFVALTQGKRMVVGGSKIIC